MRLCVETTNLEHKSVLKNNISLNNKMYNLKLISNNTVNIYDIEMKKID